MSLVSGYHHYITFIEVYWVISVSQSQVTGLAEAELVGGCQGGLKGMITILSFAP
jgi:hypothetical protein